MIEMTRSERRQIDILRTPILGRFLRWKHNRSAVQLLLFGVAAGKARPANRLPPPDCSLCVQFCAAGVWYLDGPLLVSPVNRAIDHRAGVSILLCPSSGLACFGATELAVRRTLDAHVGCDPDCADARDSGRIWVGRLLWPGPRRSGHMAVLTGL